MKIKIDKYICGWLVSIYPRFYLSILIGNASYFFNKNLLY